MFSCENDREGPRTKSDPETKSTGAVWAPWKIAGIYFVAALFWIFISDTLLGVLAPGPTVLVHVSLLKGLAFVCVTTFVLYALMSRWKARIERWERAAMLASARHRELVESANSIIMRRDPCGRITFINEFARGFFGFGEEEILGRHVVGTIIPETDRSGRNMREMVEEIGKHPELYASNENENMRANGERVWIAWTNKPVRDANGRVVEILCIGNDISERKAAEEELRRTNAFLDAIIENTPHAMWISDDKGTLIRTNNALRDLLKVTDDEILGKYNLLRDNIVEEQGRMPLVREVFGKGNTVRFSLDYNSSLLTQLELARRVHVFLDVIISPVLDDFGRVVNAIIQDVDITERRIAEEAVLRAKNDWERTFDALPDLIAIMDKEYRILRVNKAMAARLGIPPRDCVGRVCYEVVHGTDEPPFFCPHRRLLEDRSAHMAEVFEERFNGEFLISDSPLFDGKGELIGSVHICRDISEAKRAEEDLRREENKYRVLFEAASDGIFLQDSTRFVDCNLKGAAMYGLQRAQVIGLSPQRLCPDRQPDGRLSSEVAAEKIKAAYDGVPQEFEWRSLRSDGVSFDVEVNLNRVEVGGTVLLQALVRNITERKQAEEERKRLEERLQRAEKMEALGTLAGGIAHDLNNVLGIIVGYAEMLREDLDQSSPAGSKAVEIFKAGQRAAAIVQDLLTLARRGVPTRKVINLNAVVLECRGSPELAKVLSYHPNVRLETDLERDLLNMSGSVVHLDKSLLNLISNAAEAMPDGGTLSVSTANCYLDKPVSGYDDVREGDYVVLTVADTGEGISPTDLKHIFEPFYTKKIMGRSGTGLGLAVVWGTVKDHMGYIDVKSEVGNGAVFFLYFPVSREETPPEQVSITAAEYMGKGEAVLIVDDVKEQRELASAMLRKLNYAVRSVAGGEEAVEHIRRHKVDLVVLDMIMDPGIDGLETYARMMGIQPRQRAVLVSGYSETERVGKAQALGAGPYVKKPYTLEKLGMAIRKELDRQAEESFSAG